MKKIIFSIMFLGMMFIIAETAMAQNCKPKADQVAVFDGLLYRGNCTVLDAGDYPDLGKLSLLIRSIIVSSSVSVRVCDSPELKGTCKAIGRSGDIEPFGSSGYIASIKIVKNPNAPPTAGNNSSNNAGILIYDTKVGAILGGFKDGRLVDSKTASADFSRGKRFNFYGLDPDVKSNQGTAERLSYFDRCGIYSIYFNGGGGGAIALSSNARWNPVPRSAKTISTEDKTYTRIVSEYLQSKGLSRPVVKIKQILRVDLEGDGQDEVIINAGHIDGENTETGFRFKKGSYSFLIVRKIINGKVETIRIGSQIFTGNLDMEQWTPLVREVTAILDVDGDGIMEIATDSREYESIYTTVHKIKNGQAFDILSTGCGA